MPIPMNAPEVLEREFLEARARLLQLGAALDRIDRAEGSVADDPRPGRLRQAIEALLDDSPDRAERLQMIFSLPYHDGWRTKYGLAD